MPVLFIYYMFYANIVHHYQPKECETGQLSVYLCFSMLREIARSVNLVVVNYLLI